MRVLNLIFFIFLSSIVFAQNGFPQDSIAKSENLIGEWIIDLRPSPDADPYYQSFIVSEQSEEQFTGQFYGSQIEGTCLNKKWNKLYFAFKSSDNSNEYFQSGYIIGEEIFGVTFCPSRNFVLPWSGKKKK